MAIPGRGTYTLEELDSTVRTGTISGNRIKYFCQRHGNPIETYDAPLIVNDTLSMVKDVIYQEEEEDQGVIFPEGGDDPDAMNINKDPEQRTSYT